MSKELHREISEQRTAHEQRVEALTYAAATARTIIAEQRSEIESQQRENTNLTALNRSAIALSSITKYRTLKAEYDLNIKNMGSPISRVLVKLCGNQF